MKATHEKRPVSSLILTLALWLFLTPGTTQAVTTVFFNSTQTANLVASGTTSDTIRTEGYLFTVTRDKLFTGGVGMTNPVGRTVRIPWPDGLEAQAVTAGPNPRGARIDIRREDGQTFAIESFTAKLLANTAGAGGAIEVMPLLNGEDAFPDPVAYDASGYYGQNFTYQTPQLTGFDAYKVTLYVDYAFMSLTIVDASLPPPRLEIVRGDSPIVRLSWPAEAVGFALESTTIFPAQGWTTVTNSVAITGNVCTVELQASGAQRFFRLSSP